MVIEITPRSYLFIAVPIVLALSVMGLLALVSTFALNHGSVYGLVPMFLLNAEGNIPTFFSATNLLFGSMLLMLVAALTRRTGRRFAGTWLLLGLGALCVAVDEAAQVHELLDENPQWTNGSLTGEDSPWVLVYGAIAVVLVIASARLFLHLPRRFQLMFSLGAAMFVAGAIGLEIIGAQELTTVGKTWYYEAVNGVEEVLEMSAVTLVNASLLAYIRTTYGPLRLSSG